MGGTSPENIMKKTLALYFYYRQWGVKPCDAWLAAVIETKE